jgi:hypothetical protein
MISELHTLLADQLEYAMHWIQEPSAQALKAPRRNPPNAA